MSGERHFDSSRSFDQTESSLSFFVNLVTGVHARAIVEWRSRETRETIAAAREKKIETDPIARANEFCVRITTEKYDWLMVKSLKRL